MEFEEAMAVRAAVHGDENARRWLRENTAEGWPDETHSVHAHAVRMGMSVAEAEQLADILLRCPQDVARAVHDQLWLRTLFVIQRKRTTNAERFLFDARADRILAVLDPQESP